MTFTHDTLRGCAWACDFFFYLDESIEKLVSARGDGDGDGGWDWESGPKPLLLNTPPSQSPGQNWGVGGVLLAAT